MKVAAAIIKMNAPGEKNCESRTSKRQTGVFSLMTSISVEFVPTQPLQLPIKKTNFMKTSTLAQNKKIIPSLFQIATHLENFIPADALESESSPNETPFVDLMLHP